MDSPLARTQRGRKACTVAFRLDSTMIQATPVGSSTSTTSHGMRTSPTTSMAAA
jgi:hypothetical protein